MRIMFMALAITISGPARAASPFVGHLPLPSAVNEASLSALLESQGLDPVNFKLKEATSLIGEHLKLYSRIAEETSKGSPMARSGLGFLVELVEASERGDQELAKLVTPDLSCPLAQVAFGASCPSGHADPCPLLSAIKSPLLEALNVIDLPQIQPVNSALETFYLASQDFTVGSLGDAASALSTSVDGEDEKSKNLRLWMQGIEKNCHENSQTYVAKHWVSYHDIALAAGCEDSAKKLQGVSLSFDLNEGKPQILRSSFLVGGKPLVQIWRSSPGVLNLQMKAHNSAAETKIQWNLQEKKFYVSVLNGGYSYLASYSYYSEDLAPKQRSFILPTGHRFDVVYLGPNAKPVLIAHPDAALLHPSPSIIKSVLGSDFYKIERDNKKTVVYHPNGKVLFERWEGEPKYTPLLRSDGVKVATLDAEPKPARRDYVEERKYHRSRGHRDDSSSQDRLLVKVAAMYGSNGAVLYRTNKTSDISEWLTKDGDTILQVTDKNLSAKIPNGYLVKDPKFSYYDSSYLVKNQSGSSYATLMEEGEGSYILRDGERLCVLPATKSEREH